MKRGTKQRAEAAVVRAAMRMYTYMTTLEPFSKAKSARCMNNLHNACARLSASRRGK